VPQDGRLPVAGPLSLVKLRSDRADNPDALHLIYSDGLTTVSVFEQRGQLTIAPQGSQWDASWRPTYGRSASDVATWQ
jgi:hypothetical protein